MDWTTFSSRLVKDLTVGDQILITVITTLLTYLLIFGVNWLLIREGRRKDRVGRAAEAVKVLALRRDDIYGEILTKLGEARIELYRVLTEGSTRKADGSLQEPQYDIRPAIAKMEEAAAVSAKLRNINTLETPIPLAESFDDAFSNLFYDEIRDVHLDGLTDKRKAAGDLLGVVMQMKSVVQEAADFEGTLAIAQFIEASRKRLPRQTLNYLRTMESQLHKKVAWPPVSRWNYLRGNYFSNIPKPPMVDPGKAESNEIPEDESARTSQ